MPVFKFKSIEEVPNRVEMASELLATRIRVLWARAFALAPPLDFRGVRRYESIERASEARSEATLLRMRATRG